MIKKITLLEYLDRIIVTRNAIADFFILLSRFSEKEILLDFSDIEFMSRSCADEYIKRKLASHKNIKEINLSKNVLAMFLLVARQNNLDARTIFH